MIQENIRIAMLRYKKYKLWREYAKVRSELMHNRQRQQRQNHFHNLRKFTVVKDELMGGKTVKLRNVNEDLESIQEVEDSW
jgi:hypothetical protein